MADDLIDPARVQTGPVVLRAVLVVDDDGDLGVAELFGDVLEGAFVGGEVHFMEGEPASKNFCLVLAQPKHPAGLVQMVRVIFSPRFRITLVRFDWLACDFSSSNHSTE
jgi:hypothetical protein